MDQSIKGKWLEALRSGQYQRTDDGLHTSRGFTSLGVLADLYRKERGFKWTPVREVGEETLFGIIQEEAEGDKGMLVCDGVNLPATILAWAGLRGSKVSLKGYGLPLWEGSSEVNFGKLADLIESEAL